MRLRSGMTLVPPQHHSRFPRNNPLFRPSRLAPIVLQNPQHAEIVMRIAYYSLELDPDDGSMLDVVRIDSSAEIEQETEIARATRGGHAVRLKLVHPVWYREVRRIADRFCSIRLPFHVGDDNPLPLTRRLRRLYVDAPNVTIYNVHDFREVLDQASSVARLHINLRVSDANVDGIICTEISNALSNLARSSPLRLLRWNGPPIDVLRCVSSSDIMTLILDRPPPRSNISGDVIVLNKLKVLIVFLSMTRPHPTPMPDLFDCLCDAQLQALTQLIVMSIHDFPHLNRFLLVVAPTLEYLFIREAINVTESSLQPLPSMPFLSKCTLMIPTAQYLLARPQIRLAELELFAFYPAIVQNPTQRREFVKALRDVCQYLHDNKESRFPSLGSVRLLGLTDDVFYCTLWLVMEFKNFRRCFEILNDVNVVLLTDNGVRLTPRPLRYRRKNGRFSRRRILD